VAQTLDSALKERLRAVLGSRPVTEAELRKLADEGRACELIIAAQLQHAEERLAGLSAEPASSLAEIAATFREVNELQPDLAELRQLLATLTSRAREFRASWLSAT
jgi:uncharacterized protein involved in exopolysaccharide biosynthesis